MLVKSDHFPRDRGENKKYFKPPHSEFSAFFWGVGEQLSLHVTSAWQMPRIFCCFFLSNVASYPFVPLTTGTEFLGKLPKNSAATSFMGPSLAISGCCTSYKCHF